MIHALFVEYRYVYGEKDVSGVALRLLSIKHRIKYLQKNLTRTLQNLMSVFSVIPHVP
jgi:hypothetical protein